MLKDIAMLGVSSNRTKAYLQLMKRHNLCPSYCIIMDNNTAKLQQEADVYEEKQVEMEYFNPDEPILYTLEKSCIPYEICEVDSVNSPSLLPRINSLSHQYIIYAGYGGQIVNKAVLNSGKKFLHIHPGIVPDYKGSTTIYYSLLKESLCGASAIFLEEKIDTGPIIATRKFYVPDNPPDMDFIFDPYIRAELLIEVLKSYGTSGCFLDHKQSTDTGETYYIIHPVLKHIAILSEVETKRGKNK